MRARGLLAAATSVVIATALVQVALAQPRGRHARPKPAPGAVPPDAGAGADNPYGEANGAAAPAAPTNAPAPGASDAGPVPPPALAPTLGDGGVKPSPLNPAPNELPPPASPAPDYDKLLGDVSALRARVAAVSDTLFRSRIAIAFESDGSHARVTRLVVSLDDGVVFTAQPNQKFEDMAPIYEHGVAPGRHAVTVDVERRDDRDDTFRTSQRNRFLVDVPKDERLVLEIRADDDSNMAADFPGDHSGRYDLRVRAKASAKPVR